MQTLSWYAAVLRLRVSLTLAVCATLGLGLPGCALTRLSERNSLEHLADLETPSLVEQLATGRSLEDAQKWPQAHTHYQQVAKAFPGDYHAKHRLGVVCDHLRKHGEAQEWYVAALAQAPQDAELFNDLGYSYYLAGQLSKAESAAAKAVELKPTNPRFRNNLGLIVGQAGRLDDAFGHFRVAGSEADAYFNLAFIHASQERAEDAKRCFQRALLHDPKHQKALNALKSFARAELDPEGWDMPGDLIVDGKRWVPYQESSSDTRSSGSNAAQGWAPEQAGQAVTQAARQAAGAVSTPNSTGLHGAALSGPVSLAVAQAGEAAEQGRGPR